MKAYLQFVSGTSDRKVIPLELGAYVLGRGSLADIQIPSREVSRKHAQIVVEGEDILLQDCGSANGTLLNGKKVVVEKLQHGDQISIGTVTLEISFESEQALDKNNRISFELANQATVLRAATVISKKLKPKYLWPFLAAVFGLAFVTLSIFGSLSFKSFIHQRLQQEVLARAQGLVKYLAEKNREDVKLNNQLLLDVDTILREKGVVKAFIINDKGRILAPIQNADENSSDPLVLEALSHESDLALLPGPVLKDGSRALVHPIRYYNEKKGMYQNIGVAKIIFNPNQAVGELREANRLMYVLVILSILFSVLLGWIAAQMLVRPLNKFAEVVQGWRTGEPVQPQKPPFEDLQPLYEAVERAMEDAKK